MILQVGESAPDLQPYFFQKDDFQHPKVLQLNLQDEGTDSFL